MRPDHLRGEHDLLSSGERLAKRLSEQERRILTRYVYCSNNPLSFVDPSGLDDILALLLAPLKKYVFSTPNSEYKESEPVGETRALYASSAFDIRPGNFNIQGEAGTADYQTQKAETPNANDLDFGASGQIEVQGPGVKFEAGMKDGCVTAQVEARILKGSIKGNVELFGQNIELKLGGIIGFSLGGEVTREGAAAGKVAPGIGFDFSINFQGTDEEQKQNKKLEERNTVEVIPQNE